MMTFSTGSISDPLFISPALKVRVAAPSAAAKTRRYAPLAGGEATGVFLVAGESMAANSTGSIYTPTNIAKIDNIDVDSGYMYAAADPLAGCSGTGGHWAGRVADKLIAAGKYQRVILIPIGVSGSVIAEWQPGGQCNGLMRSALMRLAAMSMPATAVLWQLGANDNNAGTSQAAFTSGMNALIAQQRALGFTCPWLLANNTLYDNAVSPAIQAAIAAVINGTDIKAGANTDTLTGPTNRADGVHFTATGADSAATLWSNAIIAGL